MTENLKDGKEILAGFFSELSRIEGVDSDVAEILVGLHQRGKLTNVNITNELSRIRGERLGNETEAD